MFVGRIAMLTHKLCETFATDPKGFVQMGNVAEAPGLPAQLLLALCLPASVMRGMTCIVYDKMRSGC